MWIYLKSSFFYKLHNELLLQGNLKHPQGLTQRGSWLYVATVDASHEPELHGSTDDTFSRKSKAVLFPVLGLLDSRPNDLVHQISRVGAVDAEHPGPCSLSRKNAFSSVSVGSFSVSCPGLKNIVKNPVRKGEGWEASFT